MRPQFCDIVAVLLVNIFRFVHSENILPCKSNILGSCLGDNQYCDAENQTCHCIDGYTMTGTTCEAQELEDPSPHNATAAVVTIFTLALLICGLVLVAKRYHLVDYVRQRIILRRGNDIVYEDVMIGQDDPPLSP